MATRVQYPAAVSATATNTTTATENRLTTRNDAMPGLAAESAMAESAEADLALTPEPAPEPDLMLECSGLAKLFDDVVALSDFNLRIPQGQFVALLGPSGCGKTTALRLIAGFSHPNAGVIRIGGRPVYAEGRSVPPEKRRVGMVFQEGALFPHLTVEQNIAYGLSKEDDRERRIREVVTLTGLDGLRERMPYELSGGQQQRVALARALAPRPELLLLDEPFSNLDPALREQVRRDVMDILRRSGITAVFVTHDQEEAMYVGDSIAVMNRGRVEQQGTPYDIFHNPRSKFVAEFIGMVDFLPARWEDGRIATAIGATDRPEPPEGSGVLEAMVRPDCVEFYPSEEGNGVIEEREFRGAFYLYRVALNSGGAVRCLISHTADYAPGARVMVKVRGGHAFRPFLDGIALDD